MINTILLTSNGGVTLENILTPIFGTVIIALIILFIRKERLEKGNEDALNDYLQKITDIVKKRIIEFINNFDLSSYKEDFQTLQTDLLNGLYDDIFELSIKELENVLGDSSDSITIALIRKSLTRDKIEEYVSILLEESDLKEKFTDLINSVLEKENDRIEAEDKELEKELESYEEEYDDPIESKIAELDPKVAKDPEKSTISEVINPPREEEEETVSAYDESIEILD